MIKFSNRWSSFDYFFETREKQLWKKKDRGNECNYEIIERGI